ncbi:MAG TPA: hypothetical protein VGG79_15580 [Roseiarcus sp.]|jgi:hypothetical protein
MSGETQFHLAGVRTEIQAGLSKSGLSGPGVLAALDFAAGRLAAG